MIALASKRMKKISERTVKIKIRNCRLIKEITFKWQVLCALVDTILNVERSVFVLLYSPLFMFALRVLSVQRVQSLFMIVDQHNLITKTKFLPEIILKF